MQGLRPSLGRQRVTPSLVGSLARLVPSDAGLPSTVHARLARTAQTAAEAAPIGSRTPSHSPATRRYPSLAPRGSATSIARSLALLRQQLARQDEATGVEFYVCVRTAPGPAGPARRAFEQVRVSPDLVVEGCRRAHLAWKADKSGDLGFLRSLSTLSGPTERRARPRPTPVHPGLIPSPPSPIFPTNTEQPCRAPACD